MTKPNFIKKKMNIINFLWVFLLVELAVFFILAYHFKASETLSPSTDQEDIMLLYFAYIFAVLSVPGVFKLYDFRKKKQSKELPENEKGEHYFFSKLLQFAALELAGLFLLLAFFLNELYEPLYVYGIVYITIFFLKPSYERFEHDYLTDRDELTEEIVYMPDEIEKLNENYTEQNEES